MATPDRDAAGAVDALPSAMDPMALSLNENPFPPPVCWINAASRKV